MPRPLPFSLLGICTFALIACGSDEEAPLEEEKVEEVSTCPVLDVNDWYAFIEPLPPGPGRLHIEGRLDMPRLAISPNSRPAPLTAPYRQPSTFF